MDQQGLARTSSGLARTNNGMDSQGLVAAIRMGFKGFHVFFVVFALVFKRHPLKPMQIIGSPYSHLLKPMRIATNKQLDSNKLMKIT
jgi:hypothetical protein